MVLRMVAEAASDAKGAFLGTMGHELRTPLPLSLGAFTALLKTPLPKESEAVVRSGLRNTSMMSNKPVASVACSSVFNPGACCSHSGCPK